MGPYRTMDEPKRQILSLKERFLNYFSNLKDNSLSFLDKKPWVISWSIFIFLLTSIITVFTFGIRSDIRAHNELIQTQRNTVYSWARQHSATVDACLDITGYCECTAHNATNSFVIKITDHQPDRVFSVIRAENLR